MTVGGRLLTAAAAVLLLHGCASLSVNSYSDTSRQWPSERSYEWAPAESLSTGDARLDNNPFFDRQVRAAVERELSGRGFQKADDGRAPLLLHYHASFGQEIDLRNVNEEYGYCEREECGPVVYEAGTLVIDVVDAGTNALLWRGWARGNFEADIDSQERMERRVDDAVRRIFARLPAAAGAPPAGARPGAPAMIPAAPVQVSPR